MITYEWKILELLKDAKGVRYCISATDGQNTVDSEGYHLFSENAVDIPYDQIKESNLLSWIDKDTTVDGVNAIKLNLENQLNSIELSQKVEFPWLANTFKVQI